MVNHIISKTNFLHFICHRIAYKLTIATECIQGHEVTFRVLCMLFGETERNIASFPQRLLEVHSDCGMNPFLFVCLKSFILLQGT